ncbi:MAG TPA: hypothetical protein VE359_04865 [Vicinamibacteria bacterium]|nr:hypothetical protein [Vicinamibacteria bacterium]
MDSPADDSRGGPGLGDWLLACAVAFAAALACLAASRLVDPGLAQSAAANVWFDSDLPYRLEVMVRPGGWENGGAHPLFPSLGHLLLAGATALTGQADPLRAAGLAGSAVGGLFAGILFALFRRMGLARVDATLFAAISALSSGSLFWFPVPESFGLAGTGVALALLVAAASRPSVAALAAACVASGATVLTNGIVGFLAVVAHDGRRWGRALTSLLVALGVMSAVWSLQEWSFRTPFFLGDRLLEYRQHTFPVTLARATDVARGLLCHSVVAPALRNDRPSFRGVEIASSGPLGAIATLAWAALLLAGSWRTLQSARRGERRELALTAAGSLALMFAMHLTLGREPFLYALSVLPLLLVLAAGSARPERGRTLVRVVACVLLLAGGLNNARQLRQAAGAARDLAAQRVLSGAGVSEGR